MYVLVLSSMYRYKTSMISLCSWKAFKDEMEVMLTESDRKGMMVPRVKKFNRKTSIYTYPLPECACLQHSNNSTLKLTDSANVLNSYHEPTR